MGSLSCPRRRSPDTVQGSESALARRPRSVMTRSRIAPAVTLETRVFRADLLPSTRLEPGSRMNKLIFANLIHRPLRSIISVLAVAIEVVMILSIVAIFMGMLNDQKQRTNGIGADLVVSPSNASFMNGMSGAADVGQAGPIPRHLASRCGRRACHPELLHGRLARDSLRYRLRELQRAQALHVHCGRPVPGSRRRNRRRRLGQDRQRPPRGRDHHHSEPSSSLPHLRHRRERQGRAQADTD